jgi:hypothetical protein
MAVAKGSATRQKNALRAIGRRCRLGDGCAIKEEALRARKAKVKSQNKGKVKNQVKNRILKEHT